jgi:hypothetical protein
MLVGTKLNFQHKPYYSAGAIVILNKKAATWLIFLFVAILALIFAISTPALADDKKPTPGAISFEQDDDDDDDDEKSGRHKDDDDDDDDENERHHDRLREQYGEVEQVFLPPLVVTDPSGLGGKQRVAPQQGEVNGDKLVDASFIDPRQNAPIDPKSIQASRHSPADSFFQMASVAIGSMAAGSIALGAFAIRRSVRLRNTEDADYFYK